MSINVFEMLESDNRALHFKVLVANKKIGSDHVNSCLQKNIIFLYSSRLIPYINIQLNTA